MEDLVRWLNTQLNEDERIARAAAEELGGDWYYDDGFVLARREDDMVATGSQDFLDREHGEHIAAHDPARVLREIDVKRKLIDEHRPDAFGDCTTCARPEDFDEDSDGVRTWSRSAKPSPCPTLRLLAAVYVDRAGYQESWRP